MPSVRPTVGESPAVASGRQAGAARRLPRRFNLVTQRTVPARGGGSKRRDASERQVHSLVRWLLSSGPGLEEFVVVRVRADPEPDDGVAVPHTNRPIAGLDASGEDGFGGVDLFEVQTRMKGVGQEERVGFSCLLLDLPRQADEGPTKTFRGV